MSFEDDLLSGVATLLATQPGYTFRTDGAYAPTDGFGIYMDVEPQEDSDCITLSEYPVTDDIVGGDSVVGVQARISSSDRRQVKAATTALYDLLHGRWGGSLGAVTLISAMRSSGTNLGQDANGRLVRTENYYLTVFRR